MTLDNNKRSLLVLVAVILLALLVLASGLSTMEMSMGGFFGVENPTTPLDLIFGEGVGMDPRILQILTLIGVVGIPIAIIVFLVSPDMRRRVLRDGIALAFFAAVMYIVFQRNPQLEQLGMEFQEPQFSMQEGERIEPGESVLNPPPWAMWVASGVVLAVGGYGLWRYIESQKELPDGVYENLRLETQDAVNRLRAGENVKELVMRCYMRMHNTLAENRGVRDSDLMTPREFEQRMMAVTGLPAEPINRLTRLFERVRYGDYEATETEKAEALACLEAINTALHV